MKKYSYLLFSVAFLGVAFVQRAEYSKLEPWYMSAARDANFMPFVEEFRALAGKEWSDVIPYLGTVEIPQERMRSRGFSRNLDFDIISSVPAELFAKADKKPYF